MPKDNLRSYDSTAANNTDVGSVNTDEGMLPSKVNDAIRELMSHLADFSAGTEGIDVLSLEDDDASAAIKFQAPATVTATTTFTLPDGDGTSGQYLQTNGSGTLSWDTVTSSGAYDLNGGELTLDADGDTSITADTDDRIDFKTAGTDRMHLTSSGTLGFGTTTPSVAIHYKDTSSAASRRIRLQNSEGHADFGTDANRALIYVAGNQKFRIDGGGLAYLNSEGGSVAYVNVQQGSAKHWVNIDIQGTNSTLDSYNHTSFSDNGTGNVTINFNNDMNNSGYSVSTASRAASDATPYVAASFMGNVRSTSQVKVQFAYGNTSLTAFHDVPYSGTTTHGDLA